MGIEQKELNPNSVGVKTKDLTPQPLYWDEKKKKILDMIINQNCSIKAIGEEVDLAPWRVSRFIRDKEFQRRYTEIVEAGTEQLLGENKRHIQELMRILRREIKYKITKLSPDRLLTEYRLLLQGISAPVKENSKGPKFQQNIINPQLISADALKIIEKAVLKDQKFIPLEVSSEEINEAINGKREQKKS